MDVPASKDEKSSSILVVRGTAIPGEPGCAVVFGDSVGYGTAREVVKQLRNNSMSISSVCIPARRWINSAKLHASDKSSPGLCVRVPILVLLSSDTSTTSMKGTSLADGIFSILGSTETKSRATLSPKERVVVAAHSFSPRVFSYDKNIHDFAALTGLKVSCLSITATIDAEIMEAAEWLSSAVGSSAVAQPDFNRIVIKAIE